MTAILELNVCAKRFKPAVFLPLSELHGPWSATKEAHRE